MPTIEPIMNALFSMTIEISKIMLIKAMLKKESKFS